MGERLDQIHARGERQRLDAFDEAGEKVAHLKEETLGLTAATKNLKSETAAYGEQGQKSLDALERELEKARRGIDDLRESTDELGRSSEGFSRLERATLTVSAGFDIVERAARFAIAGVREFYDFVDENSSWRILHGDSQPELLPRSFQKRRRWHVDCVGKKRSERSSAFCGKGSHRQGALRAGESRGAVAGRGRRPILPAP